ncbi:restriction endonuclease [Amycolatopsis rifamycinica]|uniref:restriction endonuclease n=1 Tax=Amycolatopsis rifamycinica TaxID=287986 RepID=UPI0009FE6ED7|nr:restriction endonuclease [Amycolatopsis rifamycinica]
MASGRGGLSEWERRQQALAREAQRQQKETERAQAAAAKEAKRKYSEARAAEVEAKNRSLNDLVRGLESFLAAGLHRPARIDLQAKRVRAKVPPLDLGSDSTPVEQPPWARFAPRPPGPLGRFLGGLARYEQDVEFARNRHQQAVQAAEQQEIERQRRVVVARRTHADRVRRAEEDARRRNQEVDERVRAIAERQPQAVEEYLSQVLKQVPLPSGFPHKSEVAFSPRSEQAVVRFELPDRKVVPIVGAYRYLATKDEIRTTARAKAEVNRLYRSTISQVALLCVRDLFNSDGSVQSVGFNGHVHAINPATGEQEFPCIISLNVERERFPPDANLEKVDPEACIRHLSAIVSNHPYDLEPIEPILDFDLSKFSFVDGFDAVATLDSRPDLMDMSYTNFEHLVRQIFEAQGAEGWTTQQSNDDGVDAVIVQRKALMGGLSIVQAKRYSKVIGVSHIRELAGAMEEKKAGWGILITTSWFTAKCWEKAREHGRMELIDGERLKYLIKEYLKKDVLIGIPNRPSPKP